MINDVRLILLRLMLINPTVDNRKVRIGLKLEDYFSKISGEL